MRKPGAKSVRSAEAESMNELRRRFKSWRRNKPHARAPIPKGLWEAAAEAASSHGVGHVSRTLRLDYNGLRDRVNSVASDPERESEPTFVRLETTQPFPGAECVIEVQEPSGTKMTIRLGMGAAAIVPDLVEAFGRRRR